MKNVFDRNSKTAEIDGEVFCTRKTSNEVRNERIQVEEELQDLRGRAKRPLYMSFFRLLCLMMVVDCIIECWRYDLNIIYFVFGNVVAGVMYVSPCVFLVLEALGQKKRKIKYTKMIADKKLFLRLEQLDKNVKEELQISSEIMRIDVLQCVYRIHKNKKISDRYECIDTLLYVKEDALCFIHNGKEISIPFMDIRSVQKVKKNISVSRWNKQEAYNDKRYKKYRITIDKQGMYCFNKYYSLSIVSLWGEYEILIPEYEEEALKLIKETVHLQ